jgi:hypothetical protein
MCNIYHEWVWFHLPSKFANSIDLVACSTGFCQWSKCGLEGEKKKSGAAMAALAAALPTPLTFFVEL